MSVDPNGEKRGVPMNIPKHWEVKKVRLNIDEREAIYSVWGYSDGDPEVARQMIEEKIPTVIPKVEEAIRRSWAGDDSPDNQAHDSRRARYYHVDVIREQRLEDLSRDGEEIAVITRNSYGAKIINCPEVMFVDIDTDEEHWGSYPSVLGMSGGGCLAVLLGVGALFGVGAGKDPKLESMKSEPEETSSRPAPSQAKIEALARVKSYVDSNPGVGFRIYETLLGLRLIATHQLYDPAGEASMEIFRALGCDELYMRLCRVQKCFRARLTPKPWRIGHSTPHWRRPQPIPHPQDISWLEGYEARSRGYQACRFMEKTGLEAPDPVIEEVVRVHDEVCGVTAGLNLA